MKNYKMFFLTFIAIISILASCKKDKTEPTELSKLPPATQTGAKIFGCLVNGKAYLPYKDCSICTPPLQFYYDNTSGGQFGISAANLSQTISIGIDSCISAKKYTYYADPNHPIRFAYRLNTYDALSVFDTLVVASGYLNMSRFDLTSGIFSGTFEFTLTKQGHETINVTNGRFDAKLI